VTRMMSLVACQLDHEFLGPGGLADQRLWGFLLRVHCPGQSGSAIRGQRILLLGSAKAGWSWHGRRTQASHVNLARCDGFRRTSTVGCVTTPVEIATGMFQAPGEQVIATRKATAHFKVERHYLLGAAHCAVPFPELLMYNERAEVYSQSRCLSRKPSGLLPNNGAQRGLSKRSLSLGKETCLPLSSLP
jgi:hypothetical protein